jgi:DNA-binding CsgD family transcriptional regulator
MWVFAGLGLICFALLLTLEIVTEEDELSLFDIAGDAISLLLTIGAVVGVVFLVTRMQAQHTEKMAILRDLATARAEEKKPANGVRSRLAKLEGRMDIQFQQWGITATEREVGLLILKGLSNKEIAALRATTEATVRQQAQSIFRKANLPDKAAFLAYFLDDDVVPQAGGQDPISR